MLAKSTVAFKAYTTHNLAYNNTRTYIRLYICAKLFQVVNVACHNAINVKAHTQKTSNDSSTLARALRRMVSRTAPVYGTLSGWPWRFLLVDSLGRRFTCVVAMSHIYGLHLFAHNMIYAYITHCLLSFRKVKTLQ